ncbi:MAG: hypothetical protein IT292_07895 [Deltaproteobacteria bacterium]|nr:hypothetical protein [Deltaproteobacteria bacterium]
MNEQTQSYSHPDLAVRHSYPVIFKEEGFMAAFNLCMKTLPYMLMRIGAYLAFTIAAVIWAALCFGIAYLFSGKDDKGGGGVIFFIIAIGAPAGIFYWLKQYVLYMLKAGHVAVLTKLITVGELPAGINQVEYGKKIVTERFAQTNVMFALDSIVTGVARAFNGTLDWISNILPIPGMDSIMNVVHKIVDNATTFIDETIMSYTLARGDENVWRSSADGLVYYAANVKPILKTAVTALVIEYVITGIVFLIALIPAYIISWMLPGDLSSFAWVIAIPITAGVRAAILHPIFLVMVALTFHKNAQNQPINLDLDQVLTKVSDKFTKLKGKIMESAKPAQEQIS